MLSGNGLEGTLPETWGSNLNNVTILDLSQNVLSGTLPAGELPQVPHKCSLSLLDRRHADTQHRHAQHGQAFAQGAMTMPAAPLHPTLCQPLL